MESNGTAAYGRAGEGGRHGGTDGRHQSQQSRNRHPGAVQFYKDRESKVDAGIKTAGRDTGMYHTCHL